MILILQNLTDTRKTVSGQHAANINKYKNGERITNPFSEDHIKLGKLWDVTSNLTLKVIFNNLRYIAPCFSIVSYIQYERRERCKEGHK